MSTQASRKFTLEEIVERRKRVLCEIRAQKEEMTCTAKELFAPLAPAATKADAIARAFNTGSAIIDGVITGIKIMRNMRRFFRGMK
ncbi:hypothetical protein HMPREF1981_00484 [Bacteroides pyogenes F0041]|uniref:Uncharacterized protein n=1 Tax=Bacteroides pyogenes F0041 TaxID=1321819 RepID=U2E7T7_9BACE|nr:hypothetical protein [Bacteroides pyogenes]ERI88551.1 hypothetical protein HMPREF1981_00484 [Bacteroides pyogenes F0041]